MPITERTLKRWRKEALENKIELKGYDNTTEFTNVRRENANRILRMTQELLDLHLIWKK